MSHALLLSWSLTGHVDWSLWVLTHHMCTRSVPLLLSSSRTSHIHCSSRDFLLVKQTAPHGSYISHVLHLSWSLTYPLLLPGSYRSHPLTPFLVSYMSHALLLSWSLTGHVDWSLWVLTHHMCTRSVPLLLSSSRTSHIHCSSRDFLLVKQTAPHGSYISHVLHLSWSLTYPLLLPGSYRSHPLLLCWSLIGPIHCFPPSFK